MGYGSQYPIWNDVTACIYKSSKSFGAKDTSDTKVFVGTSRTNSELLVQHFTTRREKGENTIFTFGIDKGNGLEVIAEKIMNTSTKEWLN